MPISHSQYIYGNSLVYFSEGGNFSSVPVWIDLFSEANGNSYSMSGSYGFLRNFADQETPADQWSFGGVDRAWSPDTEDFSEASFDSVLITPANFIQYVPGDVNYFDDTRSPLDAMNDIVDYVSAEQPDTQIYIYEGWADMGPFSDDMPPSSSELASYHTYNMGEYHDWYLNLTDRVAAQNPDSQIELIPVAAILSNLLSTTLTSIPFDALYVDDAPHGTDTLYFLASMIVYQVQYGEKPKMPAELPTGIHPAVLANYQEINDQISEGLEQPDFLGPINGSSENDLIEGSSRDDELVGYQGEDELYGYSGNDTLKGGAQDDFLFGGAGFDLLKGGGGDDQLRGGKGQDELRGGSGADILFGGRARDLLNGGADADTLSGGAGGDRVSGGSGSDTLRGNAGNDRLAGGNGSDVLNGGNGDDTLIGGAGPDEFLFLNSPKTGNDRINDFNLDLDTIHITRLDLDHPDARLEWDLIDGGTMIDYGHGTIFLADVEINHLSDISFIF